MKRIAENCVARYFIFKISQVFAFNKNLHAIEENIKKPSEIIKKLLYFYNSNEELITKTFEL